MSWRFLNIDMVEPVTDNEEGTEEETSIQVGDAGGVNLGLKLITFTFPVACGTTSILLTPAQLAKLKEAINHESD